MITVKEFCEAEIVVINKTAKEERAKYNKIISKMGWEELPIKPCTIYHYSDHIHIKFDVWTETRENLKILLNGLPVSTWRKEYYQTYMYFAGSNDDGSVRYTITLFESHCEVEQYNTTAMRVVEGSCRPVEM